jgi:hypothetical protein
VEHSGKQNPESGFKSPRAEEGPLCTFLYFCDLAIQSKFDAKAFK